MTPHRLVARVGAGALALGAMGALAVAQAPAPPDFARDIAPILAASCVRCHTAALAQGGLRLDTRDELRKGGVSGPVVVNGEAAASLFYQSLVETDAQKRMPWLGEPLPATQIDTIRRWIEAGAPWPEGVTVAEVSPARTARARAATAVGAGISFNREIRPILADNCYACHGPDRNNRQAGLRLDREEVAKAPLPSGRTAIVPADPYKSALVARVAHPDERMRMPHVSSGKARLGPAQIETLRRWIAQGAEYEPHWSYIKPVRREPPRVRRADWVRNPVDAFVLAPIEARGLGPSPEAESRTLLRRLSFDLTGLPPRPEEVEAFLRDRSPAAYERQVDRLLASPRYGERMAVFWLDLVRYADSVGYHSDNARTVWRYRDWVVGAFNRNLSFDRFTAEQLAGDLLDNPTTEQKIASGYNRLLQTTEEGGAQPKEYRAIYLADHVRNASTVWLGATLGCAQCHDHKFDPFLARDFYSFAAFFADVKEKPVGRRDPDYLPDDRQRPLVEAAREKVASLRKELERAGTEADQERWEKTLAGHKVRTWSTLEPVEATSANGTRVLIQGNDFSVIATTASGPKPPRDTYTVKYKTALSGITAVRLEAVTFDELPKGGPGRDPEGGFVVSELVLSDASGRKVGLRDASASTPVSAPGSDPASAIDGDTQRGGWTLAAADGDSHRLVIETAEPLGGGEETTLTLVLHQNAGALRTLGRFRLAATTEPGPVRNGPGPEPTREIVTIAATPRSDRPKEQAERLVAFYRRAAPELLPLRARIRAAEVERDELLKGVAQSLVTTTQDPEPVRILPRGNWLDESGEVVQPATPHFLPALQPGGRRATRLDLARWLTSSENPLTARVFVNRLFKLYFGRGLSATLQDLGSQGEWPTHPELLDWLAVEFVESGWDVKHMVRTLVTSAAYRQASKPSRELLAMDPDNRLFARQGRWRIDAEMVRDNALLISGLLSDKMGGPGVRPYQPAGYWAFLNFPPREWDDDTGEDQYRRGLYTWWQRTFPQPSLLAFDAPSREECVTERAPSNIPQQALVLLNDPTYVEAARVLAARMLEQGGPTFEARVGWAYARALAREPRAEEIEVLRKLLRKHRQEYRGRPEAARELAKIGLFPAPKGLDAAELAAWTSLARVILNLPEVVTRS